MGMPQNWHRRQAMVLAGQLPENTEDALLVLQAVQELVLTFLVDDQKAPRVVGGKVLPFNAA